MKEIVSIKAQNISCRHYYILPSSADDNILFKQQDRYNLE